VRSATAHVEPLLLTADQSAKLVGLGRSTFYRLHSSGHVPLPVRLGGAVRWRMTELEAWVDAGCPARAQWNQPGDNGPGGSHILKKVRSAT